MLRTLLICALALVAVNRVAVAIPNSPYSLSCTGNATIPIASKIEVLVVGQDKPVVTALTVALKPGETFITAGKAKPPYKCTARVL